MRIAVGLARRGHGRTAPNPSVGAVVADAATGELIACGRTADGGRPHAETVALAKAGARAKGATLYVSLEPCAHHGRTPPCADAIVAAGIARVVTGVGDPNPSVAGKGHEILRRAGIEVVTGVLETEARRAALGHILRQTEQRPAVTIKMALDRDGSVPFGRGGKPKFVTGPEARRWAHVLRARHDAILVGGGTVRDDDPELTCRLPGQEHRSPIRVVATSDPSILSGSKLLATIESSPVWVATSLAAAEAHGSALERRGVIGLASDTSADGRIDARALLALLAGRGITRLLVEGGPSIWASFLAKGFADEVVVILAGGVEDAPVAVKGLEGYSMPRQLRLVETRDLGRDRMFILRPFDRP